MKHNLKAIYEKGVFRPLEPFHLEEHRQVTLTIVEGEGREQEDELIGMFADDPSLMDDVTGSAMRARENDPLRRPAS